MGKNREGAQALHSINVHPSVAFSLSVHNHLQKSVKDVMALYTKAQRYIVHFDLWLRRPCRLGLPGVAALNLPRGGLRVGDIENVSRVDAEAEQVAIRE
jgi:hypothetical protein